MRFLEGVGRRSEAEFYLQLFRAAEKERFATLLLESTALRHTADAVTLDLRFLTGLGLVPVVVLGIYSPNSAMHQATHLRDLLLRAEVPAEIVSMSAAPFGGGPPALETARVARANTVPLVTFAADQLPSLRSRFDMLGELVAKLSSRRLVVLGRRGGLAPAGTDRPISVVNLAADYDGLMLPDRLPQMQRFLLRQARHILLDQAQHKMTISITSPLSLLRELFTVRGAGTLIRRGFSIDRKTSFTEVDPARLEGLLVSSFGRPLAKDFFGRRVSAIYLEENYRGAAIVVDTALGGYLSKFRGRQGKRRAKAWVRDLGEVGHRPTTPGF